MLFILLNYGRNMNMNRITILNGLRGWAAALVLVLHVFFQGLPAIDFTSWQMQRWWPLSGTFAVYVFFVVSGFSISIAYIRNRNWEGLAKIGLGRYLRLVIPIVAICSLVSLMLNIGLIWPVQERPVPYNTLLAFNPTLKHLLNFSLYNVFFNYQFSETYAGVLWTMPIEFLGTFLVISVLLIGDLLRIRMVLTVFAGFWFLYVKSPYAAFFFGILLANLYYHGYLHYAKIGWVLLLCGTCLNLIFQNEWAVLVGASVFCLGVFNSPHAKVFFSSKLSEWLGWISFPLYLVHGPVMFVIGMPLLVLARGNVVSMLFTDVIVIIVSIFAAILFVPINNFSIKASRLFGEKVLSYVVWIYETLAIWNRSRSTD